jgi:hypothetical protein
MAFTPITNSQRDNLALHIDDMAVAFRVQEEDATIPASLIANECLQYFENHAGGFPGTGRDVGTQNDLTLSIPERNQLAAEVNSLTAFIEHDGAFAVDTANEMLAIWENKAMGIIPDTGRDVNSPPA